MLKILAAIDGSPSSDRAVKHLITELRQGGHAEVHLLHVQPTVDTEKLPEIAKRGVLEELRLDEADKALESARRLLNDAAVKHASRTETGDPAQAIAQYADAHECDEIVMGTRGLSPIKNLMMGSVAVKTVHLVKVPVTLVK